MLEKLREKNEQLLAWFKGEQNQAATQRQELLKVILADDACFFKLNIDDALNVLKDLGFSPNDASVAYATLTGPEEFARIKHLLP